LRRYAILPAILILSTLFVLAIMPPGGTQQSGLQVISANPGDTVTFNGQGDPNSEVYIEISTSTSIGAPGGRYGIALNGIHIPSGKNSFSISADRVETMTVSGSSLSNSQISATQAVDVKKNGRGSFSVSNVPEGTYNIMVYGTASGSTVDLSASAACAIQVDGSGNYWESLNTQGMPAGVYSVKQDHREIAHVYLGIPAPGKSKLASSTMVTSPSPDTTERQVSPPGLIGYPYDGMITIWSYPIY
jgi:hypothetical protein